MGASLTKSKRPSQALMLAACTSPALFTSFLRVLERQAGKVSPEFRSCVGAFLKAYGSPLFILGHLLMCRRKTSMDVPDWCYIAATISLSLAGAGAYRGKPFRTGVLLNGLFLFVFGVILYRRAEKAGTSTTIPTLATMAGVSNTTLGMTLLALKYQLITKTPFPLTLAQHAQQTSTLFGTANIIKLFQLLQQGAPVDDVLTGQILKVVASLANFVGNALLCGWQDKIVVGERALAAAVTATAAMQLAM